MKIVSHSMSSTLEIRLKTCCHGICPEAPLNHFTLMYITFKGLIHSVIGLCRDYRPDTCSTLTDFCLPGPSTPVEDSYICLLRSYSTVVWQWEKLTDDLRGSSDEEVVTLDPFWYTQLLTQTRGPHSLPYEPLSQSRQTSQTLPGFHLAFPDSLADLPRLSSISTCTGVWVWKAQWLFPWHSKHFANFSHSSSHIAMDA